MSTQPLNILVIAPYRFLPAVNGGHKGIERFYHYVSLLAHVNVVSVKSNDDSSTHPFRLVKLFSDSLFHYINPAYFFRLKKMIRTEKITHIITEHPYMGWLAFLLKKSSGIPWVVHSHNIEALRFKTLGKRWWKAMWHYEKWVYRNADNVFFITKEDKQQACKEYLLPTGKGTIITYGIDNNEPPSTGVKNEAAIAIRRQYNIPASHHVLLFNGDLGYAPNAEAVQIIVDKIYPLLHQTAFAFTILICGRNLTEILVEKIRKTNGDIIYTGFVNDIKQVVLAADVFINPVVSGGGIKTKLVEALSCGCLAVSTVSGSTGIPMHIAGNQLSVVPDNDWQGFANAIVKADVSAIADDRFYSHFYWGNIARKAFNDLQNLQVQ